MLLMTVKCTNVDEYGFCGRDYHPTKSDIGKTFSVIEIKEEISLRGVGETSDGLERASKFAQSAEYLDDRRTILAGAEDSFLYKTLLCVSEGGDLVMFVDFEVEIVSVTMSGKEVCK